MDHRRIRLGVKEHTKECKAQSDNDNDPHSPSPAKGRRSHYEPPAYRAPGRAGKYQRHRQCHGDATLCERPAIAEHSAKNGNWRYSKETAEEPADENGSDVGA
ncbi:hypothetical protein ACP6JD_002652 [Aspergillus fumigatus]